MTKILFVCLGNICRSPVADGICRQKIKDKGLFDISCDSAGTAAWHVGKSPDSRSRANCKSHGVDISNLRARQAVAEDFFEFDLVLAMDESNYADLQEICPTGYEHKLKLLLDYGDSNERSVPDPYYGGADGFEVVYQLVDNAVDRLLEALCAKS